MEQEIGGAIGRDPKAQGEPPGRDIEAQPDAHDRWRGEDHCEQIVQLK